MSRNKLCVCGSGKKQKRCHPDILPESRAGKLLDWYHIIDSEIESFYQQNEHKNLPPCRKGCSECCYQHFYISAIEFKVIAKDIQNWEDKDIEKLKEITYEQWEFLSKKHPDVIDNLVQDGTENTELFIKQILMSCTLFDIPCPLLNTQTGECRVYKHRPLICRLHGTATYTQEEFKICSVIPSNRQNLQNTPDLSHKIKETLTFLNEFSKNNLIIKRRPYPILYWLKLTFDVSESTIVIPEENRDFNLPAHVADEMEFQSYLKGRFYPR